MKKLFERLPDIWAQLDRTQTLIDGKGPLERFLSIDQEYDRLDLLIKEMMRSHDVEEVRDRFLPLLINHLGYRWRDYRSWVWNRNRMQISVPRNAYRSVDEWIKDLVVEHGGNWYKVIDMASLVGVYDRQASMTQSSHYFDSDFFHPGVYQLWLPDYMDLPHFMEDFEEGRPAGTKWIIRLCIADCHTPIEVLDYGCPTAIYGGTWDYTYKLYNQEFGFYDHIPQVAWEPTILTTYWSYLHNPYPNVYGQGFYNYLPQYPVDVVTYETIWLGINPGITDNIYGEGFYNFTLQLPIQPTLILCSDYLAIANARLDLASLTFDWGNEEYTFEDEYIPEAYNYMQPLVEPIILT